MSTLPRVVFAGTPEFAVPALQALIERGWPVVGVFTQPDRPAGRGRRLLASPVKRCAAAAEIPVFQPAGLRSAEEQMQLAALQPELLIVAAYGLLLPAAVLAQPSLGCINIHASLLPRWRGAAPIQRAILAGDRRTGISIMRMVRRLDAGPVYLERALAIGDAETGGQLHDRLAQLGADALLEALPGIIDASLSASPQDETLATYASKLDKSEAVIDWTRPAAELARQVRAFNPWPVAEARLGESRVRIWQARVAQMPPPAGPPGTIASDVPHRLCVVTGDGALEVLQLQWPGRRVMEAADFLGGRPLAGRRFE